MSPPITLQLASFRPSCCCCWSLDTHHTDDTFQVIADDAALRSTLLVSAFGCFCWSPGTNHINDTFRVRADDTALRSTLLVSAFGRISFQPAGHQTDYSAAELPKPHPSHLFAPRSASTWPACCTAHLRELPAQAPRSADCTLFAFRGSEAYTMHDAPQTICQAY